MIGKALWSVTLSVIIDRRTTFLYTYLYQIDKQIQLIIGALKNYNSNSRGKFEPGPEFDPKMMTDSVTDHNA